MAYNKNGGSNRVVDFKDGQPVYKRGRNANGGPRGESNSVRGNSGGARRNAERGRGNSERAEGEGRRRRYEGERPSYDARPRFSREERGESSRNAGYRHSTDIESGPRRQSRGGMERPGRRTYNDAGGRMEDFPHDIPPRRERMGDRDGRTAYREGRRTATPDNAAALTEEQAAELPNIIMGRNPVKEAIRAGRSIDRILVTSEHDGSLNEILDLARDAKLVIRDVDRAKLDEICMPFGHNGRPGNHQGIIAYIPGVEYCELGDILDRAKEKGEPPFVILLDGIEDPHNLGSIIRSAECAGAHGVVITKRRSASVTAAVVKTAAGATEHLPIAKVVNLSVAIEKLKDAGVWVAGADMAGESLYSANLKGPLALVVGAEGAGMSRLVAEKCDYLVSIPLLGQMESLNASVAAAVIMFEKVRQDMQK